MDLQWNLVTLDMYLFSDMTLVQNVCIPYVLESESIKQIDMLLFFIM